VAKAADLLRKKPKGLDWNIIRNIDVAKEPMPISHQTNIFEDKCTSQHQALWASCL
jgi:hypothetical protein